VITLKNDDVRNWVPQLSKSNIAGNQPIVEMLKEFDILEDSLNGLTVYGHRGLGGF